MTGGSTRPGAEPLRCPRRRTSGSFRTAKTTPRFFFGRDDGAADRHREPARVPADDPLRPERRREDLAPPGGRRPRPARAGRAREPGLEAEPCAVRDLQFPRLARRPAAGADERSGSPVRARRSAAASSSRPGSRASRWSRRCGPGPSMCGRCSSCSTSSRTTSSTTRPRTARARSPSQFPRDRQRAEPARELPASRSARMPGRSSTASRDAYRACSRTTSASSTSIARRPARRSSGPSTSGTAACRRASNRTRVEPALVETVIARGCRRRPGLAQRACRADPTDERPTRSRRPSSSSSWSGSGARRSWQARRGLTVDRLEKLGGAQRIVENHLLDALGGLTAREQAVAADALPLPRHAVRRRRSRIPLSDLAEWTRRPEPEVVAVLEKLCRGESGRILRTGPPPPGVESEGMRYELFHDVLAEPILDWRRQLRAGAGPPRDDQALRSHRRSAARTRRGLRRARHLGSRAAWRDEAVLAGGNLACSRADRRFTRRLPPRSIGAPQPRSSPRKSDSGGSECHDRGSRAAARVRSEADPQRPYRPRLHRRVWSRRAYARLGRRGPHSPLVGHADAQTARPAAARSHRGGPRCCSQPGRAHAGLRRL